MLCDGCGEPENDYRVLMRVQINKGKHEKVYLMCEVCRDKLCRIIEGRAL